MGLDPSADRALGIDWLQLVHWIDQHETLHAAFAQTYGTISFQVQLPLVVLGLNVRRAELRAYVLAVAIAVSVTTFIAAIFPAESPVALIDRSSFHLLKFTGATPLDQLRKLRGFGPVHFSDTLGGLLSFPSFHATVAILTPLTLRGRHPLFYSLLLLNVGMLCSTVSEGGHYVTDVIAGAFVALAAHALASQLSQRTSVEGADDLAELGSRRIKRLA